MTKASKKKRKTKKNKYLGHGLVRSGKRRNGAIERETKKEGGKEGRRKIPFTHKKGAAIVQVLSRGQRAKAKTSLGENG